MILRGARLIDPNTRTDTKTDLVIRDGKIADKANAGEAVIDLDGCWIAPGFIDLHSVLRDESELASAIRGGFTTVVAAPESASSVKSDQIRVLRAAPLTRGLEGNELGEVAATTLCLSQGFKPLNRAGVLRRALQYSNRTLLVLHAEDPSLTGAGVIGEGLTPTRLGLPSVPVAAESSIIARDLQILEETGGRLHFAHVTTARSVELIRHAKARGLSVSADVTPHHLTRDTSAAEDYSLTARVWPPLRSPADLAVLKAGLLDGTIDAIACDHVKVDVLDREHAFEACAPGCEAFEAAVATAFALELPPARLVEVFASAPARLLGLAASLAVGSEARLTVLDPRTRSVRGVVSGRFNTLEKP
ncbi:MAG: amidohydrolase family protein [Archangium sp.]|nr:amidohydrolase family protein [Archangium sp.]